MQQIVVRKGAAGATLHTVEAPEPQPRASQAIVQVHSISLNRGEVSAALQRAEDGWRPGWDFAGTVVRAAADAGAPAAGSRVAGILDSGAWAERIAVDVQRLAVLPDWMDFDVAATLPTAGLTALYALETGGALVGREVLITGATGGLGQFTAQLALLAGASVTAAVHHNPFSLPQNTEPQRVRVVRMDEPGLTELRKRRYDLVVESVGGDVFQAALQSLAPEGVLVTLGATRDLRAAFNIREFFNLGRARIYGFNIFDELAHKPAPQGLARLIRLIGDGRLVAPVTYRGTVAELDRVARDLLESKIPGKAVLLWATRFRDSSNSASKRPLCAR